MNVVGTISYTSQNADGTYRYDCNNCDYQVSKNSALEGTWTCKESIDNDTYESELYEYELIKKKVIGTQLNTHLEKFKYKYTRVNLVEGKIVREGSEQEAYACAKYGTATITSKDSIDLTMDLSGKVFLDKDEGKVNEGDNELDKGEELEGTEVWLYDSSNELIGIKLTDENGYYKFTGLNALKKYYVKFTYNGMLYTNVAYDENNGEKTSKATEEGQSHKDNRTNFNNTFAEIGSYPSNYKIKNKIFGDDLGDYNKTYLQEDIVELFKEVAKAVVDNGGDEKKAYKAVAKEHGNGTEIKRKIQFVADCRINAYTVKKYPLLDAFVINSSEKTMAGKKYQPIYSGKYSQKNVNLGIKARETVDLALYKDVLKAEVTINGKTETYNYDSRRQTSGFKVGISEEDYLEGLRVAYTNDKTFTNADRIVENIKNEFAGDSYDLNMRKEEVFNGNSANNYTGVDGYQVNNDYNLTRDDRLKVYVTYKIALRNQSSVKAAVTEVVDYYDTNYEFVEAYVGDENGAKTGNVTKYDTSMYGNEYKSTKNSYKTMYLRPEKETRLGPENKDQYIYVVFQLLGPDNDVGTLLSNNENLEVLNLAEINGYKTYSSNKGTASPGLIDIDSNPGNLNISKIKALTTENIMNYANIRDMYEDDTNRAPALIYKTNTSRTIEGTVFEDNTGKNATVYTAQDRTGNGKLDNKDTKIAGVTVELIEIKNGKMIVRATTTTNSNGWYGFTGFVPGNYTIRYTYGADDNTAMTTSSTWYKGLNSTSYNGQDYQSTTYRTKAGETITSGNYTTDSNLIARYSENYDKKNSEESIVKITSSTVIDKYNSGYYWYTTSDNLSDARDDAYRTSQVIAYSKEEYGTEIVNHKAEVFNAYVNPQPSHITQEFNRTLADELERRTYRYAYTPEMEVEVEYATKTTTGTQKHEHKITGIDFGIVERPKSELTIDQDVKHIKVTGADGTILFDTETGTNNLQWIAKGDINKYDKKELINVIMDEELINGSKIEITYNITVKNNSEKDIDSTTRAKTILNYVANNLNFDVEDNKDENGNPLWQVVSTNSVQRESYATYVNNTAGENNLKLLDLSTQAVILKTTDTNPLVNKNLKPGEQVTTTLKLGKVLSAEGSSDDLKYTNMSEIVEIDNTVGRYDHGAVPGNQSIELAPQEHDTSGSNKEINTDGTVIVTPPTGSKYIYYVMGITSAIILAAGIYLIRKFVIKKK